MHPTRVFFLAFLVSEAKSDFIKKTYKLAIRVVVTKFCSVTVQVYSFLTKFLDS